MLQNKIVKHLQLVAQNYGFTVETEIPDDQSYIDIVMQKGNMDLDVIVPKIDGEYFAYGMESTGLPRELYSADPTDLSSRSREILANAEKLMSGQVYFYAAPSFLNQRKGFINLDIDGKTVRVPQAYNYFKLPLKTED